MLDGLDLETAIFEQAPPLLGGERACVDLDRTQHSVRLGDDGGLSLAACMVNIASQAK